MFVAQFMDYSLPQSTYITALHILYLRKSNAHLNFQNLETKKKYLLANVMRIGTTMSFYCEFNFTKKKHNSLINLLVLIH
jgi:hypothetical protein